MTGDAPVVVIGAGGHAKVVVAALLELGTPIAAILDDDPAKQGSELLGVAVTGPIAESAVAGRPAILALGDNTARRRLAARLDGLWRAVVHPAAHVHPSVRLGEGLFVAAGAIVQPDTILGAHVIVNTGATIDHDCVIGSYAHVAPGAHLAGDVTVGEQTLVGIGAVVAPGVAVGSRAILGAGASVVHDIADGSTAVGVPARVRTGG